MSFSIRIINGECRHPNFRLHQPLQLEIKADEQIAIVGANGAGKSMLVDVLTGKFRLGTGQITYHLDSQQSGVPYKQMKYLAFRDSYGDADTNYYYQQRWNAQDAEVSPLVASQLPACADEQWQNFLFDLFQLHPLLDKPLVMLSSGELRKFQLTKALLSKPRMLLVDNPFIGLDVQTRKQLADLLDTISSKMDVQLVLVVSRTADIPAFITHVIPVNNGICGSKMTREAYLATAPDAVCTWSDRQLQLLTNLPLPVCENPHSEVVRLNHVSIRYGERTILQQLDWVVKRGEHWALSGENGAGKSTLLSLICADNPQSYACDIELFGRKRGTGESIWQIKKQIGYVSPEMHRAYQKNRPAIEIVASGLHDTIGLYRKISEADKAICLDWMEIFGIADWADRPFLQLSSGEQRLTLLARAFVKNPELLILDEPMHGLDEANRLLVQEIINAFCRLPHKTLIMVTHYQDDLPSCIDHHLSLKRGN